MAVTAARRSIAHGYATFNHSRDLADQVAERLEEAGRTFSALPSRGLRPAGMKAAWPDMVREDEDMLHYRHEVVVAPPSAAEVSRMDQALSWVSLIDDRDERYRHVVHFRMVVHPISHANRYSWSHIGKVLGVSDKTAERWHRRACEVIAKKIAHDANLLSTMSVFALLPKA